MQMLRLQQVIDFNTHRRFEKAKNEMVSARLEALKEGSKRDYMRLLAQSKETLAAIGEKVTQDVCHLIKLALPC